ncbi:MAG: hypothetical protein ACYC3S_18095 [Chloroflexota bacterium]
MPQPITLDSRPLPHTPRSRAEILQSLHVAHVDDLPAARQVITLAHNLHRAARNGCTPGGRALASTLYRWIANDDRTPS